MDELTPWDFINSITQTKVDLFVRPDAAKAYERFAFVINRHLSYFPDTVLHANEMNFYRNTPAEHQFKYLMAAIPAKRRFAKWGKPERSEDFFLVRDYFQCNVVRTRELLQVLSPEQLTMIRGRKEANVTAK